MEMEVPLSHPLPIYHALHPQCDSVLLRLARWIRENQNGLVYLDVGANIGDTVAAVHPQSVDKVFAVEPHAPYARVLAKNLARFQCASVIIPKACVGAPEAGPCGIDAVNGTGTLLASEEGSIETTTLDELADEFPVLQSCNLLKIDIDGHDYTALRGAGRMIAMNRPVILMESDIFGNGDHLSDFDALIGKLGSLGYNHVIAYDNYGGLVHFSELGAADAIRKIMFYQATRGRIYLDLLFGVNLDDFLELELGYFTSITRDPARQAVARSLAAHFGDIRFSSETVQN